MKLYFTRHGQTFWNTQHKMQGWKNSSLTPTGIEQALRLSRHMEDIPLDAIITSPSGRARQTAERIRAKREIPLLERDAFKEICMGRWEGMTLAEIEKEYPKLFDLYWNHPQDYDPSIIGAESFEQLKSRIKNGLQELTEQFPDKTLLLVTHGATLKAILNYMRQKELRELWKGPHAQSTCLSEAVFVNGSWQVLRECDQSHLLSS